MLGVFVAVAVIATNNGDFHKNTLCFHLSSFKWSPLSAGSSTGAPATNNPFVPQRVNNGTGPCNQHTILREPWRNIAAGSSSFAQGQFYCDKPAPASTGNNVKLQEGWYRFMAPAGTFLPTAAPGAGPERQVRILSLSQNPF